MGSNSHDRRRTIVESSKTVRLGGATGMVATLVQFTDGSLEIRTDAMDAVGRAVRVHPDGSARTIDR
ncbi:hypothetical protein [Williamsia phyllosphaerae]|uniref:Uncharacterized protein n=1 Tax=Williamsia phyllosphaerae TaxID=885042 RepID=A0ABQ1UF67_9NOCA|nr:hypothetical protein [Williamsia phyllosphaerae]GGF15951.1 hypothetical protein GCM10007298_10010 [Williamsia phyllosphaerae]